MYENIGGKIKSLASVLCWVGIVASVIWGFVVISEGYDEEKLIGILYLIVGPIISWTGSFCMYGFGELIDKVCDIERNTRGNTVGSMVQTKKRNDKVDNLEKLRSQGLITEEEYQETLLKV